MPTNSNPIASADVPRPIQAYRTATNLLSKVGKKQYLTYVHDLANSRRHSVQELKTADAFAQVAACNYDIIAVATYQAYLNPEIMARTTETGEKLPAPDFIRGFFCTKNHRPKETDTGMINNGPFPIIVNTTALKLRSQSLEAYLHDLRSDWKPLDLRTHLWVLGEFLLKLQQKQVETYEHFMQYIICMCHPKINRRLLHPWLKIYLKSLQDVEDVSVRSLPMPTSEGSQAQYANDYDFLQALKNVAKNHEKWPIASLAPTLVAMSVAELPKRGDPLFLYTEDTHADYHSLFQYFLVKYQNYIVELSNLTNPPKPNAKEPDTPDAREPATPNAREPDTPNASEPATTINLKELPGQTFFVGYMLWKLATGFGFELYLHSIQKYLEDPRQRSPPDPLPALAPGSDPETDAATQCNQEVKATLTYAGRDGALPLWVAYRDWVLLIVNHFQAGSYLQDFVCSSLCEPGRPLCIRVLVGTAVGESILPIEEYLRSEYFPADEKTKADIISFVSNALSFKKQHGPAVKALAYWTEQRPSKYTKVARHNYCEKLKSHIKALKGTSVDLVYEELQKDIKDLCDVWLKTFVNPIGIRARRRAYKGITKILQDVVENLSTELFKYGDVADFTTHFGGTLHCESCLASLLDPQTRKSLAGIEGFKKILKKTKGLGHVIGVSKRSCPSCQQFLSLLSTDDPFSTQGSHNTVTNNTLPTWSLDDVVSDMNKIFGQKLKDAILAQMKDPGATRRDSVNSYDSRRLSTGSYSSDPNETPKFSGISKPY